jgi:hypothetical protein
MYLAVHGWLKSDMKQALQQELAIVEVMWQVQECHPCVKRHITSLQVRRLQATK